jgi:D-3-phosphoglycerate dehydrogenase
MSMGAGGKVRPRIAMVGGVTLGDADVQRLQVLGDVTLFEGEAANPAEVVSRIGESEIAVTGGPAIDGWVMERTPNLSLISVWSTGYNHVDVEEAARRSILVCNVRGFAAVSVGEHAMALALALAKRLPQADRHVRAGGYDWFAFWNTQLAGKTFGVVGAGAIGGHVAKLAGCFGCRVIAHTRHPSPERAARLGLEFVSLERLLEESDFICLCAQLSPETRGLIGPQEFARMARRPILVNVARGGLVDQEALLEALQTGQIAGAGLDVLAEEPPTAGEPILHEENVILTPHNAGVTRECMANLNRLGIECIEAYLRGEPINVVS